MSDDSIQLVKGLATRLFASLVAHTGDLLLVADDGRRVVAFDVYCHPGDVGRVLGKKGAHFLAVRAIVKAASERIGSPMALSTLVRPMQSAAEEFAPFRFNPEWPRQEVLTLLKDTCDAVFGESRITSEPAPAGAKIQVRTNGVLDSATADMIGNLFVSIGMTNGAIITVDIAGE